MLIYDYILIGILISFSIIGLFLGFIKIISKFSDIKGGGRDDMAQAGGSKLGEKPEIIEAISEYIKSR